MLLESGAAHTACDSAQQTPLHVACQRQHVAAARVLLAAGADAHAVDSAGKTPLQLAGKSNSELSNVLAAAIKKT